MKIKLSKIHSNADTQARYFHDHNAVEEYAQLMLDGVKFPPIILFGNEETGFWML